ncbi:WYL domain-containing protein [Idiomarina abyssalis]|uniref:WYL domain-containing protein n=1 Tax=Idiomarina abyssalis TaxID=86102 RepID=UPI003A91EDC2
MSDTATDRQKHRLKYIDLCAYVLGVINRKMLEERFDVKEAWATKDLKAYRDRAEHNLVYQPGLKAYKATDWFSPVYEHTSGEALSLLCNGEQTVVCAPSLAERRTSYTIKATNPDLSTISPLLRATFLRNKCKVSYLSRSSGESTRIIVPHSVIKTGSFSYVRAYDEQSNEYRSFKLNRVIKSTLLRDKPEVYQSLEKDREWNTYVSIDVRLNSDVENKQAIEFDYGLENGKLTIHTKAALVMFFLNDWGIAPLEYPNLPAALFPLRVHSIKTM